MNLKYFLPISCELEFTIQTFSPEFLLLSHNIRALNPTNYSLNFLLKVYGNSVRPRMGLSRGYICALYNYIHLGLRDVLHVAGRSHQSQGQQTHCEMQSGRTTAPVACSPELYALLCFCLAERPDPSIPSSLCA